jgi:hypothetical protein
MLGENYTISDEKQNYFGKMTKHWEETGDRRQKTGDRRQESGVRAGVRSQKNET